MVFILLANCFSFTASAKKHIVTVANFQFSPVIIPNVFVGDTIRWVWVSGNHTTTCDQNADPGTFSPAGAATWNAAINGGSQSFQYKVTVAGQYQYTCVFHSVDMGGGFTASVATPVDLLSFSVEGEEDKAILNWNVENEQNVDFYAVRRSLNGIDFNEIGKIPAEGNASSKTSYSFSDTKISPNQLYYYYGLAVVDKDGQKNYSETKVFKNINAPNKLIQNLSPNPLTKPGHLNLKFNAVAEGKMQVLIVNPDGKTIIRTTMQAYPGINGGHIHLGELPSGTYSLVCQLNGIKEIHKLIYR